MPQDPSNRAERRRRDRAAIIGQPSPAYSASGRQDLQRRGRRLARVVLDNDLDAASLRVLQAALNRALNVGIAARAPRAPGRRGA